MPTSPAVVLLGHDETLLKTRQWLLEGTGLHVYTVTHVLALNEILKDHKVDLLILCHSLSVAECERATAVAQSSLPKLKILALTASYPFDGGSKVNQMIDALEGPKSLLTVVEKMVRDQLSA